MTENLKNTYIGQIVEVVTSTGKIRNGTIISIDYHDGLKEDLYTCVSKYGNKFRLTRKEFTLVKNKSFHGFDI